MPQDGLPHIAFAGRSNVGKSSLQNALLGRKNLVRVSATPGKTREINFYLINKAFYFVDLPGIGYAKISKTQRASISKTLNGYLENSPTLIGLLYLIDIKTTGTSLDVETFGNLCSVDTPLLPVVTKLDKLNTKERNKNLLKIQEKFNLESSPLAVSSRTGKGLTLLWSHLSEAITE